jgi:hypothetical protein
MQLIDGFLAAHDARLVRGTLVRAPAEVAFGATLGVDLVRLSRRDPVMRLLIAGRSLPDRAARLVLRQPPRPRAPASGSLRDLPGRGLWIRLGEDPGREFVFGAIGRFWTPRIEWRETASEEFLPFLDRGWGKIAGSVLVEPMDAERTALICELRVGATDPRSGLRFQRYWRFAKPGVWLILGRVLAAARREAEAAAHAA